VPVAGLNRARLLPVEGTHKNKKEPAGEAWSEKLLRAPSLNHASSPYVKRQKNDAADAEAICEAVTRANMRFVETKTPERTCL
jgi:hypothetical protein